MQTTKAIALLAALALTLSPAMAETIPGSCHDGVCLDDLTLVLPAPDTEINCGGAGTGIPQWQGHCDDFGNATHVRILTDDESHLRPLPASLEDIQAYIDYLRTAHNVDSLRIQNLEREVGQLQQAIKALKAGK